MACLAHVGCINVGSGFASGGGAVVAVETRLPSNRCMIELGIPVSSIVTGITRLCGGQMIGAFTNGDHIVMAIGTQTDDLSVIHDAHLP